MVEGEFIILRNGVQETYTRYDDIPMSFDNLIKFMPRIPPSPHSHDQHCEIESVGTLIFDLMQRERK